MRPSEPSVALIDAKSESDRQLCISLARALWGPLAEVWREGARSRYNDCVAGVRRPTAGGREYRVRIFTSPSWHYLRTRLEAHVKKHPRGEQR